MLISVDEEKALDNIQCTFMIKALKILGIEENYLDVIKAMYENPRANIKLIGESLKTSSFFFFFFKIRRQGCLFLLFLFNTGLEILGRTIRQERRIKCIQFGKYKYLCLQII